MDETLFLDALAEEVNAIKATLDEAKAAGQTLNEAQTEYIIIDPILKRLGYSPLEVFKRHHDGVANNFPDYTILDGKPQKWFLEAKRLDLGLHDGEAAQAVNYANNQGAEWAVLTNGRKWYIYNAHLPKPLPEKRVLQIEDLFVEEQALRILLLLSKPSILNNDLKEAWQFQQLTKIIDEQLKSPNSEVRKIFLRLGSEATKSDLTDEMIGKALLFAAPTVAASTGKLYNNVHDATAQEDVPIVKEATEKQTVQVKDEEDAFYTFDKIARDITLATFRKPKSINLGGKVEDVKTWADVARMVVEYIGTTSSMPPMPYSAGSKGKNYFLNSAPTHANGKKMQSYRTAVVGSETIIVDTNRSALNICACLMTLMKTAGVPLGAISVRIG